MFYVIHKILRNYSSIFHRDFVGVNQRTNRREREFGYLCSCLQYVMYLMKTHFINYENIGMNLLLLEVCTCTGISNN